MRFFLPLLLSLGQCETWVICSGIWDCAMKDAAEAQILGQVMGRTPSALIGHQFPCVQIPKVLKPDRAGHTVK